MPNMRERRERDRYTMQDIRLPWWALNNFQMTGAEDPPEGGSGGDGGTGGQSGSGDGTDGGDGGDGSDDGDDPDKGKDTEGLKAALRTERRQRQQAEREAKRLKDAEEARSSAEKTELQRAQEAAEKATSKATRLAEGYKTLNVNNAILAAAQKANFHDPEDAVAQVDRSAFSIEQDEDDPSKVTVDKKGVETAVKALATKKPHLVKSGTSDQGPTGGQFGNNGRGSGKGAETTEQQYQEKYPAL